MSANEYTNDDELAPTCDGCKKVFLVNSQKYHMCNGIGVDITKQLLLSNVRNYNYGTPAQLEQDMLDDQERELKADKPDEREGVEL